MLDELLGRAELKSRVETLEAEVESLEAQRDAESERRAEAVRERQAAEERVNRLQDRIAELEDRVEREAAEDDGSSPTPAESVPLRGARLVEVLDRLDSVRTDPEGALTAFVDEAAAVPDDVTDALGDRVAAVRRAAPCLVCADDAALVGAALVPPVSPSPFATWSDGFALDRAWFRPRPGDVLAVVRGDVFALGRYDGEGDCERVAGFTSDVKGDHSKGGFSQARFERRRDAQIAEHVERSEAAIAEQDAERLFLAGERTVLDDLDPAVAPTASRPVDATGDPDEVLATADRAFWTTRLTPL